MEKLSGDRILGAKKSRNTSIQIVSRQLYSLADEIAHAVAESQGSTVIDDIKAGKYFAWGVFPHAHLHKGRYHVVYVLCRLRGEFHVDF